MTTLFLHLLNMSITASWLVLAVLPVRLLFKKAPKALVCALWAVVAIRLLCPFSLESAISLIPSAEPIPQEILYSPSPTIDSGIPAVNKAVNPILSESLAPNPGDSVNPMQVVTAIAANLWILGVIAMLIYAVISYIRIYRKVRVRLPLEKRVYECDGIDTPFILGIIRPHIYLPSTLSEADRSHVLAHEQAHLMRLDHLWKPLGFALLTVYWFNPLLWGAYIVLCRDIELACDERVIRKLDKDDTAAYTEALLHCSAKQRFVTACPLAFGESGVKARIKNVLNYKKPAFRIVLLAVIACVAVAVCFLTDPIIPRNIGADSELDGLSISIKELDTSSDTAGITILWNNKTAKQVTYGEIFRLYRLENGQFIDTDLLDNRAFHTIGYLLSPHRRVEKHYHLSDYDLSDGVYRFESAVNLDNDTASYKVWVGFEIENGALASEPRSAEHCEHAWLNATCTVSKNCVLCQTPEGEPLGHDWATATCFTPKTCRVCTVTEGGSIPHAFVDATCEVPKTCSACGETVSKALGHDYADVTCTDVGTCSRCGKKGTETLPHTASDATCTTDAVCTVCNTVVGEALGHNYTDATCTEDGTCTRCGEVGSTAYGHSFTGGKCYEPSVCENCGAIGETKGHWGIMTCKGTLCWDCGEFFGEGGNHMFDWSGHCTWCDLYDPDKDTLPFAYSSNYSKPYEYDSDPLYQNDTKDPLDGLSISWDPPTNLYRP